VHVLTKIFIVLVALLAVMLVPLVVVYAHNESSFREQFLDVESQLQVTRADAQAQANLAEAQRANANSTIQQLQSELSDLRLENQRLENANETLEARNREADLFKVRIDSKLASLASAVQTGQELNSSLVAEVRDLRDEALQSERRRVQIDERLREVSSQLEVAVAARRALEEEVELLREEKSIALSEIQRYRSAFGALSEEETRDIEILPDRNLQTTVIGIDRGNDRILAEIGSGERDGVKVGWKLIIERNGQFIGNLRIVRVEPNSAVGEITLENPGDNRVARVGDRVIARRGR